MNPSKENEMLKIKGIDHINMNVTNLKETIAWYQELFGHKVYEEGEYIPFTDAEPFALY